MGHEALVKRKVKELLNTRGAYWFMPTTWGYGKSGVPDFVVCYRGVFVAIETKSGDEQPTLLQKRNLADIIKRGGVAIVINEYNLKDLNEVFDKLDSSPDQSVAGFGWTSTPT